MPTIVAQRRSSCAACSMPIDVGEQIDYERHRGARHLTCTDRAADARRNLYPATCDLCAAHLPRHAGELHCIEREVDGKWERRWVARCVDAQACDVRIRANGCAHT